MLDRDFISAIGAKPEQLSPEQERNRQKAGDTLESIFQLRASSAFGWYEREILLPKIEQAEQALKDPATTNLAAAQAAWRALAELHDSFLEREITARQNLKRDDEEIPRLTERKLIR